MASGRQYKGREAGGSREDKTARMSLSPSLWVSVTTSSAPQGFWEERALRLRQGQKLGPAVLVFGCRSRDSGDQGRIACAAWHALHCTLLGLLPAARCHPTPPWPPAFPHPHRLSPSPTSTLFRLPVC